MAFASCSLPSLHKMGPKIGSFREACVIYVCMFFLEEGQQFLIKMKESWSLHGDRSVPPQISSIELGILDVDVPLLGGGVDLSTPSVWAEQGDFLARTVGEK